MSIHRFKCSKELNDEIINFAQIHKFDTNETLEEQWNTWMKSDKIMEIVENEKSYLQRNHYPSQIDVKIFKSIKYYYIKKFLKPVEKNEDAGLVPRLVNRLPIELKEKVQEDIIKQFEMDPAFKPSDTYETFKQALSPETLQTVSEASIKKCYKNQYYQLKHKKYASTLNAE
jgi:hypothetical protein